MEDFFRLDFLSLNNGWLIRNVEKQHIFNLIRFDGRNNGEPVLEAQEKGKEWLLAIDDS